MRTLSKSHALAGLRVGYVIADESLIAALNTVKDSFNSYPLDCLAQAGAAAAIEDTQYYEKTIKEIMDTRTDTVGALYTMGVKCLPSHANFLFMKCDTVPAKEVFQKLREKGVLVRWFDGKRTKDYLRVTIGTPEDMQTFLAALKEII
ncbi:Histidinol-phosphate aminotransferase [bioreactor metagenome]|uniref:Histidinol-phosphate aminotransferase n=1 Tax=bioreactor metagenome TaxID=1076179 RepID=A0A645J6D8_9ZZZZ